MHTPRFVIWIIPLCLLAVFSTHCATDKKLTVGATALLLEDIAKSAYKQTDTRIIREGMPSYLLLMDGADIIPELTLLNTIAHQRAAQLMQEADDYF